MIGSVGPKVSSVMQAIEWSTSTSTVGSKKRPRAPVFACPPVSTVAPASRASSTWRSTMSSCGGNVIAPTSTLPGPPGAPWRSALTFSVTLATNSSYTGASTYTRSTEMHVCPPFCIE